MQLCELLFNCIKLLLPVCWSHDHEIAYDCPPCLLHDLTNQFCYYYGAAGTPCMGYEVEAYCRVPVGANIRICLSSWYLHIAMQSNVTRIEVQCMIVIDHDLLFCCVHVPVGPTVLVAVVPTGCRCSATGLPNFCYSGSSTQTAFIGLESRVSSS